MTKGVICDACHLQPRRVPFGVEVSSVFSRSASSIVSQLVQILVTHSSSQASCCGPVWWLPVLELELWFHQEEVSSIFRVRSEEAAVAHLSTEANLSVDGLAFFAT